jgi:hypothetical protein
MPVLLTLILDQVDIVMTGLFVLLRSGVGGGIALAFGWIRSNTEIFPFGLLQLAFGLPAFYFLCRFQIAGNSIKRLWLCYGAWTLVVAFFSRVFKDNHLGYILALFDLGFLSDASAIPLAILRSEANGNLPRLLYPDG